MPETQQAALTALWQDVWVRFHSLPESRRYAHDEAEYAVLLERYNTVLDELFTGTDVYVITSKWTSEPDVPLHQPGEGYWQSLLLTDDPDPEFRTYIHLSAAERSWHTGCIDHLLRDVADDKVADVLITDTRMQRIHHPYDGGADIFLTTAEERDRMSNRHATWLSSHPAGL